MHNFNISILKDKVDSTTKFPFSLLADKGITFDILIEDIQLMNYLTSFIFQFQLSIMACIRFVLIVDNVKKAFALFSFPFLYSNPKIILTYYFLKKKKNIASTYYFLKKKICINLLTHLSCASFVQFQF